MTGKDCDKMRDGGEMHCGHVEEGLPCCQCGYVRWQPWPCRWPYWGTADLGPMISRKGDEGV